MCSRWYRSHFKKFQKAWIRVEILCLDFWKTPSNQNMKLSKVATFENCEIFSNSYFSYVRDYKAILAGGNKMYLRLMITVCIKQHLSNILSSVSEKVTLSQILENVAYKKEHVYHCTVVCCLIFWEKQWPQQLFIFQKRRV